MYWTTPSGTRYQTGSPRRGARAAVGGRDGEGGDLDEGDPVLGDAGQRGGVHLVAGPGAADEVRQLEEPLRVAPGEDVAERVGAGDEVELGVGVLARAGRFRVSIVYVGPSRSTSTRDTRNRGLAAVAITVIR